jgi:hypothetical protein
MCKACYLRAYRGHDTSGPCSVCGLADARMLRRHHLADGWTVLCGNHAAVAGRRTLELEQLRAELTGPQDRRRVHRRRADRRHHLERRQTMSLAWLLADRREGVDRREG